MQIRRSWSSSLLQCLQLNGGSCTPTERQGSGPAVRSGGLAIMDARSALCSSEFSGTPILYISNSDLFWRADGALMAHCGSWTKRWERMSGVEALLFNESQ